MSRGEVDVETLRFALRRMIQDHAAWFRSMAFLLSLAPALQACSLLNTPEAPAVNCLLPGEPAACANATLAYCQSGQAFYEFCADEGKICGEADGGAACIVPTGSTNGTGCVPSCGGQICGNDGCGGSCGACPGGQVCTASGNCTTPCTPQCAGKSCGGDGCGGSCGACSSSNEPLCADPSNNQTGDSTLDYKCFDQGGQCGSWSGYSFCANSQLYWCCSPNGAVLEKCQAGTSCVGSQGSNGQCGPACQ